MKIRIFGKKSCGNCQATRDKFSFFLKKWNLKDIEMCYYDLDTSEGLTEGACSNALLAPPTTIIEEEDKELIRFEGKIPTSEEFKTYLLKNGSAR